MHDVTLIDGDGPPLQGALAPVLEALGVDVRFETPDADGVVDSARRTGAVLMGYSQGVADELSPIVRLRKALGVFCNLRPVQDLAGLDSVVQGVDILIVRETTEDIYAHLEHESIPGVFESLKVTTEAACERIARQGFELAREHGRKKLTIVHKANIMKLSDGLFLRTARRVAESYPDIEVDDVIVDALCMKLVLHPEWFDVLLTGNLFGDIVSDLCTGLVGGEANAPSINMAPECTVFTTGHRIQGNDPLPLLVPTVWLLRHLGEVEAAGRLRTAIESALTAGVARDDGFCGAVAAGLRR